MAALTRTLPLLLLCSGCVTEPLRSPGQWPATKTYKALGQEPGWALTIANGRIDYVGNYGDKRINLPRPDPRTTFNGHRYETQRLIVDVTHARCNDAMSGHGYADRVTVTADGETYSGCGGERRTAWDN